MPRKEDKITREYTAKQRYAYWVKYNRTATLNAIAKCSTDLQYINAKALTKWSIKDGMNLLKFPPWLLGKVYSAIDLVIYRGKKRKGRIVYLYIPEEWTVDGHPIIIDVVVDLIAEPPEGATVMNFRALKDTFIHNQFKD